jgi:SAM-dependent methyltransferase
VTVSTNLTASTPVLDERSEPTDSRPTDPDANAIADQVFAATLGAMELLSIYLGDRLGWYRSLRQDGPATPALLAERTGTSPRYAQEWLEQQAVVGLLRADTDGPERRYTLPSGAAEVLTDVDSLSYLAPLSRMIGAVGPRLAELLDAYRTGDGVSWDELGADARESQADMNRPWFLRALPAALRSAPALDEILRRPGARILDVGCGAGWSSIALAEAYPSAEVVGVDIDAPSIEMARRSAATHRDVAGRLNFRTADAGTVAAEEGRFDAAFAFECVHDMPRPVEVLSAVRRAVRPDGIVVVMDEAVGEEFTAPGNEVERLMYGFSLFVCLPDGMSSAPSAGTGTVMRPSTLRRYAREAGFSEVDVLPIDDFGFFRFYHLR